MLSHKAALLLALPLLTRVALAKDCQNFTVPATVSGRNAILGNQPRLVDNFAVTQFTQNFTAIGANYTDEVVTGYTTNEGVYTISAQYCKPSSGSVSSVVQVLTHGIGFDKTYWDFPIDPSNYSYLDVATDSYGYQTLSYDRLCTGNSSLPDPYNVCQFPAELSILNALTSMVRNGSLPIDNPPRASHVVHVGHSYGSVLTYGLAATFPDNTQAIALTGYSQNASFMPATFAAWNLKTASSDQPGRFGPNSSMELDNGYLVWSDVYANQYTFLYPPFFSQEVEEFDEATKQPLTVGELFTAGTTPPAGNFTGAALVITGQQDQIYCGGDCYTTGNSSLSSIPATVQDNLPNAHTFQVAIHPDSGHAINLHFNATGAYKVINNFFKANGL